MLPFYYNKQLKKYIIQFMNLFTGMQVHVGATSNREAGLIPVPVHYSSMDKVSASIAANGTSNKPLRLPVMSADMVGLRQNTAYNAGLNTTHSQTYLPEGGFFATDVKTLTRLKPAAYIMDIDLAIWTSNDDQHFQLIEQILSVFNPSVQIQTSDSQFDWTKIANVHLTGIRFNSNYPVGTANRIIMTNLTFEVPIYLSAPADARNEFVKDVLIRLAVLDQGENLDEMLNILDERGEEYESVASVDDVLAKIVPTE